MLGIRLQPENMNHGEDKLDLVFNYTCQRLHPTLTHVHDNWYKKPSKPPKSPAAFLSVPENLLFWTCLPASTPQCKLKINENVWHVFPGRLSTDFWYFYDSNRSANGSNPSSFINFPPAGLTLISHHMDPSFILSFWSMNNGRMAFQDWTSWLKCQCA